MVELVLMVLVLVALLGWALESWSEKALARDSESVLAQRGKVLALVLGRLVDWALLLGAVSVLALVLVKVLA